MSRGEKFTKNEKVFIDNTGTYYAFLRCVIVVFVSKNAGDKRKRNEHTFTQHFDK